MRSGSGKAIARQNDPAATFVSTPTHAPVLLVAEAIMYLAEGLAEMQGLYGPYLLPEKLIQQIWARGDYDRTALRLCDGRELDVLSPGRWNGGPGPDFLGARLRIAGVLVEGDVEIHAREPEWMAHGHADDPAYSSVVLHVVLFPAGRTHTSGFVGNPLPILELLPRLLRDLEEYAADAAVEKLAGHPLSQAYETLRELKQVELLATLHRHAVWRWQRKVERARARLDRFGFEGAAHATALEVLGYRLNRGPMLELAHAVPLPHWYGADRVRVKMWMEGVSGWVRRGMRPANQPFARLLQYASWATRRPEWPGSVRSFSLGEGTLPQAGETAGAWRRRVNLAGRLEAFRDEATGGVLCGTRWETWVGEAVLPLLAAQTNDYHCPAWYWWRLGYAGDVPSSVGLMLRRLGLIQGAAEPMRTEWVQGVLGWLGERERNASVVPAPPLQGEGT